MSDKKKTNGKSEPEHVVCSGEVRATITMRQSNSGYCYLDFPLTRQWAARASGKQATGNSFFEKHEEDLVDAVRQACLWIRNRLQNNSPQNEMKSVAQAQ